MLLRKELIIVMSINARKSCSPLNFNRSPKEMNSVTRQRQEVVKSLADTRGEDFVRPEQESKHLADNCNASHLT